MPIKTREEVTVSRGDGERQPVAAGAEPVSVAMPTGTVKAAAEEVAEQYETDEIEEHARAIATAWEESLKRQVRQARTREGQEAAEPITVHGGTLYQWWNVLLAGPFQPIGALGAFLPHKIVLHGEPAFMLAAIVRNPNPIPGGPNPSAAQVMAPYEYRATLQTGNLTTWDPGPTFGPQGGVFGGGFVSFELFNLTGFAAPPDGQPNLYEGNMVMDIVGPGQGLPPFAGYSTWVIDPDIELPFLFAPGQAPRLQHDIPARFLLYR